MTKPTAIPSLGRLTSLDENNILTVSPERESALSSGSEMNDTARSRPRRRRSKSILASDVEDEEEIVLKETFWARIARVYELQRKALHSSIGFLALAMYCAGIEASSVTPSLLYSLVPIVAADWLRFHNQKFNNFYISVLGFLMRESERMGWNGVIWYLVGAWTVMHFFPKDIAIVSLLLLSWCDTAASGFGRAWGRYGPSLRPGKSLIGTLSAAAVGSAAGYLFWGVLGTYRDDYFFPGGGSAETLSWNPETSKVSLGGLCAITGIIGAFAEQLDVFGLDDNVVIPIVSACLLQVVVKYII
ncbi:Diacylglycerol kinase [Saitoella coloradoensis]